MYTNINQMYTTSHVNNQGGDHFVDKTNIYGSALDVINFLGSHKLNDKQNKVHEPLTVNQQVINP